jgi:isoleucyl-tRNA synthetase
LPSASGPDIPYVAVREPGAAEVYVLAEARLAAVFPKAEALEVLDRFPGSAMAGWTYAPLFPYYAGRPGAFRVLTDSFVSTGDGTGIVHIAPAYGEDDFRIGRAAGLELADPLDAECRFTAETPEYAGMFCKDADKPIIRRLKDEGAILRHETIVHNYPFCERTDTPLIYRAIDAWYVRVEDMRERLVANNSDVHWVPDHVGRRRFENWLREAKDWNISRNRFWGSCLPVWIAEDGSDMICVGSIRELEELSGETVTDLHKHHVDRIVIRRNGKTYRRTPEVLDCWFESGSMPYAQQHYPFERAGEEAKFFPAQFIAEGLDQTRGWFYTLLVLGTALFDRAPYRNVVVNGLILAADGRKMSKRLKNYPDPQLMLDTYGADALRLYMIHSPVVRGEDLCFSEEGVKHALRELLIPLWNAYAFFVTYARVDGWTPAAAAAAAPAPTSRMDRWILSALDRLTQEVGGAMDQYDLQAAVRAFVRFIGDLTNWYIRRSRRRFWKSDDDADKAAAYATLYEVLLTFSRIAAPFTPFVSEAIYGNLRRPDMPASVHWCDFPAADGARRDPALEREMEAAMVVVGLGRQLRAKHDLKVRQPLAGIHVVCADSGLRTSLEELRGVIAEELNVREVWFNADEHALAHVRAKPNFRTLGPRLGPAIKAAAEIVRNLPHETLADIQQGGRVMITVGGREVEIGPDDILIERIPKDGLAVAAEGELVVGLETALSPDLRREGLAREIVSRIQNLRKARDYEVTQRIRVRYWGDAAVREAIAAHRDYIAAETLCTACEESADAERDGDADTVNGSPLHLWVGTDPA